MRMLLAEVLTCEWRQDGACAMQVSVGRACVTKSVEVNTKKGVWHSRTTYTYGCWRFNLKLVWMGWGVCMWWPKIALSGAGLVELGRLNMHVLCVLSKYLLVSESPFSVVDTVDANRTTFASVSSDQGHIQVSQQSFDSRLRGAFVELDAILVGKLRCWVAFHFFFYFLHLSCAKSMASQDRSWPLRGPLWW